MIDKVIEPRFSTVQRVLEARLSEKPPTHLQLLVGPRQVGKTTLLLGLERTRPGRALYASADAPEASLPGWADRLWSRAMDLAAAGPAFLLLDEVQHLPHWSQWLKARFDSILRDRLPLHIVATGSSSLTVGAGARETMAGRFERLSLTHWPAADLIDLLGVPAREAPHRIVTHGGYPGAATLWRDPTRWRAYLRDSIIEPAINRDILQLEAVRKPALLRQLFALATAHPAEILSLEKIAGSLAEKGALDTVSHYLDLLHEAFLVAGLRKYAGDEIRRRRAPAKLVVLDNALLAGMRTEPSPSPESEPVLWGRWLENACLAHAINAGQEVSYWREEPWEIDGVLEGTWGRWLVEVKSGAYGASDLRGLSESAGRLRGFKPIVICDPGRERAAEAAGFSAMPWTEYLRRGLGP